MKSTICRTGALALPVLLAACASMMKAPEVPAAIAVPAGNKPAFMLVGSGLLNYECRANAEAAGGAAWALASPDAVLKDSSGALVGKYYGGPTWEHADGSKITGKQLAVSPSPTPGSIPWQLVQAAPATGSGMMTGVTYVQRTNTNAGVAPADPCATASVGKKAQVRYSADYWFYKG
jgi:Protein of unknown function (DUF3455)